MLTDRPTSTDVILAAGAVVWRGDPQTPEIALVHRDRYGDWSFPKGKLDDDEHVMVAAAREVHEEAGARVALGARLPTREYAMGEARKRVDYWSARYIDGSFTPNDEVDELRWAELDKARALLTHPADRTVLDAFAAQPRVTVPIVLVRHAKAKSRSEWREADAIRPLTARGGFQAERFAHVMATAYEPLTVISSPWLRCMQTVSPYAGLLGSGLAELNVLGEREFEEDHDAAREAVRQLIHSATAAGQGLLLCSHGNVMDTLIEVALEGGRGVARDLDASPMAKGEFVVVQRALIPPRNSDESASGGPASMPVTVERHRP